MYDILCCIICVFSVYGIYSALREVKAFFLRRAKKGCRCDRCDCRCEISEEDEEKG